MNDEELRKLKEKLQILGRQYYEKRGPNAATVVFWELEQVVSDILVERGKRDGKVHSDIDT